MFNGKFFFTFLFFLIFIYGFDKYVKQKSLPTNQYSYMVASDWIDTYRMIVKETGINPPKASRLYAYAGITMYESVYEGVLGNISLQGQLNGFEKGSIKRNTNRVHYGHVLNEAMFMLSKSLLDISNRKVENHINYAYRKYQNNNRISDQKLYQNSVERGREIAEAIIEYSSKDNLKKVNEMTSNYVVPNRMKNKSYWEYTDTAHKKPVEPYWGLMRPFVLDSASQFFYPSKIPFSTDKYSEFYNQALEVVSAVRLRTPEHDQIRRWWTDNVYSQTPSGHWVGLIKYVLNIKKYKLDKAVELYAITSIAGYDGFLSCWDAKYKYNLLRPETYIRQFVEGYSTWSTKQEDITPPFPEYPSGHSVCSAACAGVLTNQVGLITFTDSLNVDNFLKPRTYHSFFEASQEAGISRIMGGIHYREAIVNGLIQGNNISTHINSKISFKKIGVLQTK